MFRVNEHRTRYDTSLNVLVPPRLSTTSTKLNVTRSRFATFQIHQRPYSGYGSDHHTPIQKHIDATILNVPILIMNSMGSFPREDGFPTNRMTRRWHSISANV